MKFKEVGKMETTVLLYICMKRKHEVFLNLWITEFLNRLREMFTVYV